MYVVTVFVVGSYLLVVSVGIQHRVTTVGVFEHLYFINNVTSDEIKKKRNEKQQKKQQWSYIYI